jgi:hypothetical protein
VRTRQVPPHPRMYDRARSHRLVLGWMQALAGRAAVAVWGEAGANRLGKQAGMPAVASSLTARDEDFFAVSSGFPNDSSPRGAVVSLCCT